MFVKIDIWRIRNRDLSPIKAFFTRQFRIILLVIRGFHENRCGLRASSLTFYTALSIVPLVAMAFGISTGFGYEKIIEKQLMENFPGQEEVVIRIIIMARSLLEKTKGSMVAGVGSLVLLWTVMKVLMNIEGSLNEIWRVKKQRTFGRKFSDYLTIMLICPLFAVISSSLTVFITSEVRLITEKVELLEIVSPLIFSSLKLLPYGLIWVLLTIVYIMMPNTKVSFFSGFLAGLIAGTIYQLAQWSYIRFQVGVANYNAIYGSFAALPLFLIWLRVSWLIVLLGAQISFAYQNVDACEFEDDCMNISFSARKLFSLYIARLVIKNFSQGKIPLTAPLISHTLDIPIGLVREIVRGLSEIGILSRVENEEHHEPTYQPSRGIDIFTVKYVIDALEERGVSKFPTTRTRALGTLSEIIGEFGDMADKSPGNRQLRDI